MRKNYVNDEGDFATIIAKSNSVMVYTDLSAVAIKYNTVEDAESDLLSHGYYLIEK